MHKQKNTASANYDTELKSFSPTATLIKQTSTAPCAAGLQKIIVFIIAAEYFLSETTWSWKCQEILLNAHENFPKP